MQLSKSKSRRRQSNSSSSSRPGSPDPKTPRSDKAKGSKSSSRLRSSASSGNLAGEGESMGDGTLNHTAAAWSGSSCCLLQGAATSVSCKAGLCGA
jgi:hypothetical protein